MISCFTTTGPSFTLNVILTYPMLSIPLTKPSFGDSKCLTSTEMFIKCNCLSFQNFPTYMHSFTTFNRSEMVAMLGPFEALPYYIHTYIHTYIHYIYV
jgi:hypothetical protein